jgi:hypothetical protein
MLELLKNKKKPKQADIDKTEAKIDLLKELIELYGGNDKENAEDGNSSDDK